MITQNYLPFHVELKNKFFNNENKIMNYDKIFDYVTEFIILYDEQLEKYEENRLFNIKIDYNNKNIFIYSFDKLLCFIMKNNKNNIDKIYAHKYIDKFDNIIHNQYENFIFELIKNINKNFNNIILSK
jgi:hypothetical protein